MTKEDSSAFRIRNSSNFSTKKNGMTESNGGLEINLLH